MNQHKSVDIMSNIHNKEMLLTHEKEANLDHKSVLVRRYLAFVV
jgi:hypothetical protein